MLLGRKSVTTAMLAVMATTAFSFASAAEPVGAVARIQGTALISQGEAYVAAREGMPVREGDRMIATEGSSAIIKFADGCQYTLADTQVLTVGGTSTCAAGGTVASYPVNPHPAAAGAGGAATAGLIAAGVLASVVVIGIASDDDDDNPPPPARSISP
jgi:hypothetical protein